MASYHLMNGDREVLLFDLDERYLKVIDNTFLPYPLKDYIEDTDITGYSAKAARDIESLRDFFAGRTLNLSRDNAKTILGVSSLPQTIKTSDRIEIMFACAGLSITDNFWVRKLGDARTFSDVNLRNHHLGDIAYEVSINGKYITISNEALRPDLATDGMFAKTWVRKKDGIYLWKTDRLEDNTNTKAELKASELLDNTNVHHVKYTPLRRGKKTIAVCKALTDNSTSLINAGDLKDWCTHTGQELLTFVEKHFLEDIAKMCVIDYILANPDRHLGNIHFLVDNYTNEIMCLAPLLDFNQALISDNFGVDLSEQIYDLTKEPMLDSAVKYFKDANLFLDESKFPKPCTERLSFVRHLTKNKNK